MALEGIRVEPEIEPTENPIHPPRWADALLRSVLKPDDVEAVSGDLIEEYRDSIRPLRGRWQADLWYLQQVVSCMLRTTSPMNLRQRILAGLTVSILILAFSALVYPNPHPKPGILVGIITGFLFYAYVAVWRTRARTPEDELVLRLGTKWGLAIGTVWLAAYILFLTPLGFWIGWPLALAAFALSLICGAHGAIKTWRVRNGMRVGFWSGLVSGLTVFLAFASFSYILAFVPGLPGAETMDGYFRILSGMSWEVLEFPHTPSGMLSHVFGTGAFSGAIGGLIGGCTVLLARTGLSPEEKRRLPHWR